MIRQYSIGRNFFRRFSQRVSTTDLYLPKNELRQLFHLVHPDKFQGEEMKEAREINQQSLSNLNTIVDYAAQVWKDVSKSGERTWFRSSNCERSAAAMYTAVL